MKKDFSNRGNDKENVNEESKKEQDNSQREIQSILISDGIYKSVYKDTGEDVV